MDSTSASIAPVTSQEEEEEESRLIAEGRRYLVCNNFSLATQTFQEACQIMSLKYGELAGILAEPYYLYGKSLLELARQESNVLGGGVPVPADNEASTDEEEEDQEEEEEVDQEEEDQEEEDTAPPTEITSSLPAPPIENTPSHSTPPTEITSSQQSDEIQLAGGLVSAADEGKQEEDEKEVTTLQLAWEILEVSRVICQKEQSVQNQLLLAEVSMLLGEVSLESDQYDQAVEDFTTSLQVREAILSPDDRKLAEAHFNLGLTYSLMRRSQESIAEFELAKQVLELRKEALEVDSEKAESEEGREKMLNEIHEITNLLPDIESKITEELASSAVSTSEAAAGRDSDHEEQTAHLLKAPLGFPCTVSSTDSREHKDNSEIESTATSTSAPLVNDISHLVRKKSSVRTNGDHSLQAKNEALPLKRKRVLEEEEEEEKATDRVPVKKTHSVVEAADSTTHT